MSSFGPSVVELSAPVLDALTPAVVPVPVPVSLAVVTVAPVLGSPLGSVTEVEAVCVWPCVPPLVVGVSPVVVGVVLAVSVPGVVSVTVVGFVPVAPSLAVLAPVESPHADIPAITTR